MSLYGSPFQKFAITISIRFNKFKNWLYQIQKYLLIGPKWASVLLGFTSINHFDG